MSALTRLERALQRFQELRGHGTDEDMIFLRTETLETGMDVLQMLHDTIVDGFSAIVPSEIIDRAHEVADVPMSVDTLPEVVERLQRLSEVVMQFHCRFLCQPDVNLAPPPTTMPDDTDEELRTVRYDPRSILHERENQILSAHGLMQEGVASYIARIHMQLLHLHSYCSMAQAMTDMSTNANVTSKCLRLHLTMRVVEQSTSKEMQRTQMVLDYLLNDCLMHGYCCKREQTGYENTDRAPPMVMRQIRTSTGFGTGCYEEYKTVHQYVSEALSSTNASPVIAGLIIGQQMAMMKRMAELLAFTSDMRFPTYDPDPYLYAFQNGTYHLRTLTYRAYGSEESMTIAMTETSNCTEDDWRYFQTIAREANENMDRVTDEELESMLRNRQRAPCMFIDKPFDADDMTMDLAELESKCAPLKRILEFQGFDSAVRNWIWTLFGRALFLLPDVKDKWATALYIMGRAGTGKSTLLELLLQCIPRGGVVSMPSRFEQVFGWQTLYGKRLVIASEFPENVPTKMLQSALSGELMQISKKGLAADHKHWITQIIFAANNFWSKNNENNELTRRLAIIEFLMFVDRQDPNLKDTMREMLPTIIVFFTRMYNWYATEYGHLSFAEATACTTVYFANKALERFIDSNPIARYLSNVSQIVRSPSNTPKEKLFYMEWTWLQQVAADFALKTNGKNQLCIEMKPDKYETILHTLGLSIYNGSMPNYRKDYVMTKGTWLIGCVHIDDHDQLNAHLNPT